LIDDTFPTTKFHEAIAERVAQIVNLRDDDKTQDNILRYSGGLKLSPLQIESTDDHREYKYVGLKFHRDKRYVDLTMRAPEGDLPNSTDEIQKLGDAFWPL